MKKIKIHETLKELLLSDETFENCCKGINNRCILGRYDIPVLVIDLKSMETCNNFEGEVFESYNNRIIGYVLEDVILKDFVSYSFMLNKVIFGAPSKRIGINYCYSYKIVNTEMKCIVVFDYETHLVAGNSEFKEKRRNNSIIEKELLINKSRLDAISKNISEGYIFVDTDMRIVDTNNGLCKILEQTNEELVGLHVSELFEPNEIDNVILKFNNRMSGIDEIYETSVKRKDGSLVPISVLGTTHYNEEGVIIGSFAVVEEITRIKRIENDLILAKKEAERLSNYKSDFMANMSHEIRTPMNAIIGMTQLCLNSNLESKQRSYLEKVAAASNTLLRIINDMLDFSKIESGKLTIDNVEFGIRRIVEDVSSFTYYRAKEKNVILDVDIDKRIPDTLIGDPLRFEQILLNLTNNAVKFTEVGSVSISISLVRKIGNMVGLELIVKDTGIGISDEKLKVIFDAFIQTDISVTRKYGGTGLGLTITKQLVELMNGNIEVKSKIDEGTEFKIELTYEVPEVNLHEASNRKAPKLFGLRVLIFDENINSTNYLTKVLESFTFNVHKVNRKVDAVKALEDPKNEFDMILIVQGILSETCEEFINIVKDSKNIKECKMILVSSYGIDNLKRYKNEGLIDQYILNPTNASLIYETILGAFAEHHQRWYDKANLTEKIQFFNVKILVVEDNNFNQIVAKDILQNVGVEVEIAENGAIALKKLEVMTYDLVIMDVQMPVMDGYEATRRIREMDINLNKHTKVIALTANALKGDREKCIGAGMDDYITKPITPERLVYKVLEWIDSEKYEFTILENNRENFESENVEVVEKTPPNVKEEIGLYLKKLKLALESGKISKVKEIVNRINGIEELNPKLKVELEKLTLQIDDYEYSEAESSIIEIINTLKDDEHVG